MAERNRHTKEIVLKGKWISDLDGIVVAENYTSIKNMRYTDLNPRTVGGMTKLNSTAATSPRVRNAHHFRRPSKLENHLLMQCDPQTGDDGYVKLFESSIPSASNTITTAWTEAINGPTGYFSDVQGGGVAYCNSVNSLIWSGNYLRVGSFINLDILDKTFLFDHTEKLNNSLNDVENRASIWHDDSNIASMHIGSIRPISGVNFTVYSANPWFATSYWQIRYWNGSFFEWIAQTADTTNCLQQSGYLTFASTVGVAEVSYKYGLLLYWYEIELVDCSDFSLSEVTLKTDFQPITNIWDGVERNITGWYKNISGTWTDDTINVYTTDYDSSNELTYSKVSDITPTDYMVVGFMERMSGIRLFFPVGKVNTTDSVEIDISYWSGTGWVVMPDILDNTSNGTTTFTKDGTITWPDPGIENQHKSTIYNEIPMFYYRLQFTVALSADTLVYHATGIPSSDSVDAYVFPLYAMDRLMLCNSVGDYPNKVLIGAQTSDCVFNGDDSVELYVGDENAITGGAWLYSQFGSSLYNVVVFTKYNETWLLTGNGPENWTLYRASANIGCPAPLTIKVVNAPQELYQQSNRTIAIWQSSTGIYVFDGKAFTPIHGDIEDWFDTRRSYSINRDYIHKSSAFYDELNQEYHWLFKSGVAAEDKEFVYDLKRKKWYEMDRGTGKKLTLGVNVQDIYGNPYVYGFTGDGYIQRLEYGNTFDGNAIVSSLATGDIALHNGSILEVTKVRNIKLVAVGKSTTTNNIVLNHYGDTNSLPTAFSVDPTPTVGTRIISGRISANLGDYVFHRFGLNLTTSDEAIGFEPVYLGIVYESIRLDTRTGE